MTDKFYLVCGSCQPSIGSQPPSLVRVFFSASTSNPKSLLRWPCENNKSTHCNQVIIFLLIYVHGGLNSIPCCSYQIRIIYFTLLNANASAGQAALVFTLIFTAPSMTSYLCGMLIVFIAMIVTLRIMLPLWFSLMLSFAFNTLKFWSSVFTSLVTFSSSISIFSFTALLPARSRRCIYENDGSSARHYVFHQRPS